LIGSTVYAQDAKLGYIDSWKIFENYKGKSEQQAQFDREQEEWETKATQMEQEIQELKDELENNIMWSEERKLQQRQKIEEKQAELQEYVREIWGPEGKAYQRNAELTNPIIEEIIQVVQEIGVEENYSMILDVAESGIVYAAEGLDLTQRIIDVLNERYEEQKGQ
jgi:outer membrane protein